MHIGLLLVWDIHVFTPECWHIAMPRKLGGVHFITELAAGQYLSRNLQVIALQWQVPRQILGAS